MQIVKPLEGTIDGSGVPQTYGAEGESRWLLWRTAPRYKAIERAWSGTCWIPASLVNHTEIYKDRVFLSWPGCAGQVYSK